MPTNNSPSLAATEPSYNPAQLIKDGQIVANEWTCLTSVPEEGTALPSGKLLVPLALWQQRRDELSQAEAVGVWLDVDQSPKLIADDLPQLSLVAVNFPVFTDGRGFSYARELREQHQYQGEIRAIGAFLRDQLHYLRRCGVNSFALETAELEPALESLQVFSDAYQASIDSPEPLFRRR